MHARAHTHTYTHTQAVALVLEKHPLINAHYDAKTQASRDAPTQAWPGLACLAA